jgi:hypothetical protein
MYVQHCGVQGGSALMTLWLLPLLSGARQRQLQCGRWVQPAVTGDAGYVHVVSVLHVLPLHVLLLHVLLFIAAARDACEAHD